MATSQITEIGDWLGVLFPPFVVGVATWLCFRFVSKGGKILTPEPFKIIGRLAGLLLTAFCRNDGDGFQAYVPDPDQLNQGF